MLFWEALLIGFILTAVVSFLFGKLLLGSYVTMTTIFIDTFLILVAAMVMGNYFIVWTALDQTTRVIIPAIVNLIAIAVISFWSFVYSDNRKEAEGMAFFVTITLGSIWLAGVVYLATAS